MSNRPKPHGSTTFCRHSHRLLRDDSLTKLASAIPPSLITIVIMRGSDPPPLARANDLTDRSSSRRADTPPLQPQLPTSGLGSNARRDHDILPVPHPIPPKEHRSECDRRIEELKHSYEQLLREKDVRIAELRKEKDGHIEELERERDVRLEELKKERDSRIGEIKGEKDARIEELKKERDSRIEEIKREKDTRIEEVKWEKDARIEEVKRDREVAVKNVEEQLERSRREVLQLREENARLKDEITRLKIQLGQAGR